MLHSCLQQFDTFFDRNLILSEFIEKDVVGFWGKLKNFITEEVFMF